MTNIKSNLFTWFVSLAFMTTVVGCQSSPVVQEENAPITLELWTLQLKSFEAIIQPMLNDFEAHHPNVSVRWVDVPFSQGEKRTLTALLSPTVPDVVNLNPDFAALLAYRGTLVDMNTAVPKAIQHTYLPVAWQAASMQLDKTASPITFGLPWYLTSSITFANKAILGSSTIPTTLEGVEVLARSLNKQHIGYYAVMPNLTQSGNGLKALFQAGLIDTTEPTQLAVQLEKPAVHRWIAHWVGLYQQGFIPAEALTEGPQAAVDRYQSGTLALMPAGANFLTMIEENAPEVYQNTTIAPQFLAVPSRRGFSEMLLVVPRKSQYPQLAVKLALHLTNAANQLALAKAAPVLPSIQSALSNPFFRQTATPIDKARAISATQLLATTQALPLHPRQKDINALSDRAFQSALLVTISVPAVVTQWQTDLRQLSP
ncbi:MAG: extracellular solute-binding protein [Vampirovibrionales bacterium]|nr:extracellular solute-binding protein [Vampirovibrionales bacterium]